MAHRGPLCSIQTSRGPTYTSFNTYMLSFSYYNLVYLYLTPPLPELATAFLSGPTSLLGHYVDRSYFLLMLSMRISILSLTLTYRRLCHASVVFVVCRNIYALFLSSSPGPGISHSTTLQFCCPFHSSENDLLNPGLNPIFQFRLRRLHFSSTFFKHPRPP